MKSSAFTLPMLALLIAGTAGFVACGAETSNGISSGGTAGTAGTGATSGGASAGASSAGTGNSAGTANDVSCPSAECGPALGLVKKMCADGSVGGPTGRCLRRETGGCSWEVRHCPPAGEGGASASASGGAAAAGAGNDGAAGAGGAPFSDQCGGCDYSVQPTELCIYQAGGPGPSRFVCATRTPCKAAGACACIVDQGTCSFMSEGGGPGYCVCDNGLE